MMSYSSTDGGETSEVRRVQSRTLRRRRIISRRRMMMSFIAKGRVLVYVGCVSVHGRVVLIEVNWTRSRRRSEVRRCMCTSRVISL